MKQIREIWKEINFKINLEPIIRCSTCICIGEGVNGTHVCRHGGNCKFAIMNPSESVCDKWR